MISDQLREAIERSGKSRYRISIETGIQQSTLSRFIQQGTGLSLENIDRLCEYLGAELKFKNAKRKLNHGKPN